MPAATVSAVRKQLQEGTPDALYLLQGEDDIEKSALAHEFEELIEEGIRAFNVERLHGGQATTGDQLASMVGTLDAAVRTLPMMASRRLVIVLHAEGLLVPKRESDAAARALDRLERLFKRDPDQTTIVLVAESLDKRSRMYKLLSRIATLVECGVVETQADAERWIRNRMAATGMQIEPAAARLLAVRCGTDLKRLRNDVERLALYALGQKAVTAADVRDIAGPAALQDDWAMTNAIEAGNGAEALRQLALLLDAGAPAEKILGQLAWVVRAKLPLARPALRAAIDAVFRTDLDLKRSAGQPSALLERLVVQLCAAGRGQAGVR
jgi:DNA polymerase-3 subunit delta